MKMQTNTWTLLRLKVQFCSASDWQFLKIPVGDKRNTGDV
jgi:hypothetical protein